MSKKVSLRFPHSNVSVLSFCHGAEEQCLLGWITIVSMRLLINKISCSSVSESKHSINSTSALQGSCGQVLFNVSLVLTVRLVMSFSLWRIKMYFASVHCNKTFFFWYHFTDLSSSVFFTLLDQTGLLLQITHSQTRQSLNKKAADCLLSNQCAFQSATVSFLILPLGVANHTCC